MIFTKTESFLLMLCAMFLKHSLQKTHTKFYYLGHFQKQEASLIVMASKGFKIKFLFLFIILSFLTVCSSSGTSVGFSFDARRNSRTSPPSSSVSALSFLKTNQVSSSQIRVFVADHKVLDTISNTGIPVDIYLTQTEIKNLGKSKASLSSWLETHLIPFHTYINFTSIIVGSSSSNSVAQKQLPFLLPTLNSVHLALKSLNLDHQVKVSVGFSLSVLKHLHRKYTRDLCRIMDFIQKHKSFVMVETDINEDFSMEDQFIGLITKSASSAATTLHCSDASMVLNVKSSVIPSSIEVLKFTEKMMKSLDNGSHIKDRISGVFVEISPIENSEQREVIREEEELIFHSTHRELLNQRPISALLSMDDTFISPTPVTIPTFSPTPTIVNVPTTNPVSIMPTNPTTTPITVPSTNPIVTNPITVPSTNPVNPPSTVPGAFPVTTPITVPMAPPTTNPTNPVTTYPVTPPTNIPITNPGTPPTTSSPVVSGQSWCVAKTGAMETALQAALDYACGVGSVDCSVIQSSGSCYNPNTLQSHASYAFNSYYQKNPAPTSCDFGGAAMIVNNNPSTGSCVYPSSSSSSTTIPPPTTASTGAGTGVGMGTGAGVGAGAGMGMGAGTGTGSSYGSLPPILNTSDPNSPPSYNFGSQPPPGISSTSVSIAVGLQPLLTSIIVAVSFVTGNLIMHM